MQWEKNSFWAILLNFPMCCLSVKGRQMNFTLTPSDRSMKYQLLLFMRSLPSILTPTHRAGAIKTHEFRSVTGISISHRRHVIRYTGRKTKMGVQNVWRGRQRSHRYSGDDKNRSGMINYYSLLIQTHIHITAYNMSSSFNIWNIKIINVRK